MKKTTYMSIFALLIICLVACGNEDKVEMDGDKSSVKIQASIGSMTPATRAVGTTWENNDAIGVYMKKAGQELTANIVAAAFNIKYTTSGNGIFAVQNSDQAIYYPNNGDAVDLIAYYPYRDVVSKHVYTVDVTDQSKQANIDLLYSMNATNLTNASSENVNMSFAHQLSKIVLDISLGEGITSLDGLTVDLTGQKTNANFELANAQITETSASASDISLKLTPASGKMIGEAIIIPSNNTADRKFVFTLADSRKYEWIIPSTTVFEKGKKYTYNVVLKLKEAEVIKPEATITNWEDVPSEDITAETGTITKYKLVWEESFDGNQLDKNSWNIEVVPNPANNEYQYYRAENISVGAEPISGENCLILTAKKEDFGTRSFTSGRLNTMGRFAFKYGRMDARVKAPKTGDGLWPAFWMKGNDNATVAWPMCGEIDILEMGHVDGIKNGISDRYLGAACHWGPSATEYKSDGKKTTTTYSLQDDGFHLYTIIWDKDNIKMYLDLDKYPNNPPYYTFHHGANPSNASQYFNKEYYILFNLAVGGGYTGITGAANIGKITALNASNNYEAKMYIDYVKVYQSGSIDEELSLPLAN